MSSNPEKIPAGSNNTKTIIIVVVLMIAVAVASYFLYPIVKDSFFNKQVVIPETVVNTNVTDTIPKVEEVMVEQVPFKQESSSSVDKGFYIIVGSYHQKANADNLVKKLKKDIEANVLYFSELNLYRVSAGKYGTIHKAYNDVYSIKDIDGCASAWVLENN